MDDGETAAGTDAAAAGGADPAEAADRPAGFSGDMLPAAVGVATLFLLVQLGALALVDPFVTAGYQQVEDPSDPTNSLLYLAIVLVATGGILLVVRLGVEWVLRVVAVLSAGLLSWYVFSVAAAAVLAGPAAGWLALLLAAGLAVALYAYPEWYVIDVSAVVIGAGGAALFGISFGPLPALVLLLALGVYDAISVYRTEHMLTLAESVTDLKLPLVVVVPLSRSYSFLADDPMEDASEAGDREAFFVGLGDLVIPTVLVASAGVFLGVPPLVSGLALTVPAAGAMLGTLAGLAGLLWMVAKGRAHAGLPLLNGGAIAGYLVGALASGVSLATALGLTPYL